MDMKRLEQCLVHGYQQISLDDPLTAIITIINMNHYSFPWLLRCIQLGFDECISPFQYSLDTGENHFHGNLTKGH